MLCVKVADVLDGAGALGQAVKAGWPAALALGGLRPIYCYQVITRV